MKRVQISSMGHRHSPYLIPNDFFESLSIGTTSDWINKRTGINQRYSCLSQQTIRDLHANNTTVQKLRSRGLVPFIADMAKEPWEEMLERKNQREGGRSPFNPQVVISGCSVPDYDIPANAALIASRLNLQSMVFDVNSACSSFVTDLMTAQALLQVGQYENAAIFNIERYSTRMDFTDRSSCILFGDGGTCTLIEEIKPNNARGLEIIGIMMESDPKGATHVSIPVDKDFSQNGRQVQKFAISKTIEISKKILACNGLSVKNVSYFVGHQANLRMLQTSIEKLGITADKHLYNIDRYGNQGAAGAPSVLSENWDRFKSGDLILTAVVGSGLTWGAALLKKI